MPGLRLLLVALAVSATVCDDLAAQSAQPISLQVSGLYNGVFGQVFTGLGDGIGGEAQVRYTPGALSFGAGFQYTTHGLQGREENARLYGGFVEPRYRIHAGSNIVAPYLSARFSVLKVGFSGGELSLSSAFIQLNGGGGLLFRVGPRVNLDVGGTFGYDRLGAGTLRNRATGSAVSTEPGSGSNIVARVGLAFGLGG
jgi:hypothetical protein